MKGDLHYQLAGLSNVYLTYQILQVRCSINYFPQRELSAFNKFKAGVFKLILPPNP